MNLRFVFTLAAIAIALFGLCAFPLFAGQTSSVRVIKPEWRRKKTDKRPIEITKIKTAGQEVFFDTPFTAEGEWLKDLTFTIKNVYSKPMVLVNIQLVFYDLKNESSGEPILVWDFASGKNEYLTTMDSGEEPISIPPGDEVDVTDYKKHPSRTLTKFLQPKGSMSAFHRMDVTVNAIFADNRIFYEEGHWGWHDIDVSCKCILPKADPK